jgi:site-specific recombinase XerC
MSSTPARSVDGGVWWPLDRLTIQCWEAINMATSAILTTAATSGGKEWYEAVRLAAAFLAGFRSPDTRKGYQRDLHCWLEFCAANRLHPYRDVRRTHVEVYLRQLEQHAPRLRTRRCGDGSRRCRRGSPGSKTKTSTSATPPCASDVHAGTRGHSPWLDRNELTDLLAAAEADAGYSYALVCLLGLNGLRVSEACSPDVGDLGGARYQPTLRIVGKGDKPLTSR